MLHVMISASIRVTTPLKKEGDGVQMSCDMWVPCCHKLTPDPMEHPARGIGHKNTLEFVEVL